MRTVYSLHIEICYYHISRRTLNSSFISGRLSASSLITWVPPMAFSLSLSCVNSGLLKGRNNEEVHDSRKFQHTKKNSVSVTLGQKTPLFHSQVDGFERLGLNGWFFWKHLIYLSSPVSDDIDGAYSLCSSNLDYSLPNSTVGCILDHRITCKDRRWS